MLDKIIAEDLLKKAEYESENNDDGVSFETSIILQEAISMAGGNFLDYLNMKGDKLLFNAKRFKRHFVDGKFNPDNTNSYFKSDTKLFPDSFGYSKKFFEKYDCAINKTDDEQSKTTEIDANISYQTVSKINNTISEQSNPALDQNTRENKQIKKLVFSEDIYDGDILIWCANKEYTVTFENDELFYVTSENNNDSCGVEKKDEGSLFEIII